MSFGRPHHCKRTLIRVLLSPESEKDDHVKSHTTVNEIHDDDPGNDRVRANVKDSAGLDEATQNSPFARSARWKVARRD